MSTSHPISLIFSTTKDIRNFTFTKSRDKPKTSVLIWNYLFITAIDFHYAKKKMCWSDQELSSIYCCDYDGNIADNKVNHDKVYFSLLIDMFVGKNNGRYFLS